jgi:hypothetical protein
MEWWIVAVIVIVVAGVAFLVYHRRKALRSAAAESGVAETDPEPTDTKAEVRAAKPIISELSSLPEEHKKRLLGASWYLCENPECKRGSFLDIHQIVPDIEGGTYGLDNLIILCSNCHAAVHNGEVAPKDLKSWIRDREDRFKYDLDWPYK